MNKWIVGIGSLVLLVFLLVAYPLSIFPEDKCLVLEGTVEHIWEGDVKVVSFRLAEETTVFYINRRLENGLDLDRLRNQLIGEKVEIKYPTEWTSLNTDKNIQHISKLSHKGQVVFSEIEG